MKEETLIKETVKQRNALTTLLEQMDVPEMRCDTTSIANIRWLNRNLGVRNRANKLDNKVFQIIFHVSASLIKHQRDRTFGYPNRGTYNFY